MGKRSGGSAYSELFVASSVLFAIHPLLWLAEAGSAAVQPAVSWFAFQLLGSALWLRLCQRIG